MGFVPTAEQRAAWRAAAEERAGEPPPGWSAELRRTRPSIVECDQSMFFAAARMARAREFLISDIAYRGSTIVLGIYWSPDVQKELF